MDLARPTLIIFLALAALTLHYVDTWGQGTPELQLSAFSAPAQEAPAETVAVRVP